MTIDSTASAHSESPGSRSTPALRVALVGAGARGIAHATVLGTLAGCELVGVADPSTPARRNLRGMGHRAPGFRRLGLLLAKVSPQAVFLSTPLPTRAELVREALEAGVAVFVEWPIAPTAAESAELVALAASKRLPLAVAQALAYEPVFDAARRAVASGALGRVKDARASMYASRVFNPREAAALAQGAIGGVVAHLSVELLFVLMRMLGTPTEVRATSKRLYGAHEDELHSMMTLPEGVQVGFDSSWSVPGHPHPATVIELAGERGHLLVSDDALEVELEQAGGGFPAGHTRRRIADLPQTARFDLDGEARWLEDHAFVSWVTGGSAPPTTGDAAVLTQRVMEALYASAADSGAAVKVSP